MSRWRKSTNHGGKGLSPSQFRKQQNANGGRGKAVPNTSIRGRRAPGRITNRPN